MRIGAANGSTHVPNINNLNSHPDKVNQRKNIIAKLLPKGVSKKSFSCFLYLGQLLLKSMEKVRQRSPISRSRSIERARSTADWAMEPRLRETEYRRSIRSAVFLASNRNWSNPSLALRQASLQVSAEAMRLAKLSISLRRKARILHAGRQGLCIRG